MLQNLAKLFRFRGLIQTLVVRDLKARYRGSVLGFFWSFFNPLMLLLIYTFVFTKVLVGIRPAEMEPYALFMFCGILPWTWFSSSLLESSNTLIAGGNLIKKVLFPAEVLPIVTVLANMVHFFLGLPILAAFVLYYQRPIDPLELLWFPVIVLVQLVLTTGLALFLSALTVHFRDVKDLLGNLLTLWFFSTPIIYPMLTAPEDLRWWLNLNPMTHLMISYQEVLFFPGPHGHYKWLLALGALSVVVFLAGYFVFDRLRDSFAEEV
ncbi:MAG: ABC transporter permease [Acidobacteriota bacterium]|nr:ABC transporter permease [Acidobacteriota bacterium]